MDKNFVDKTVIVTPQPRASSTAQKKKASRPRLRRDQINSLPESDSEGSYGILSIKSEDLASDCLLTAQNNYLQEQRLLAESTLQNYNRLSQLPSRYLRPSDTRSTISTISNEDITSDASTISDSDLFRSKHGLFQPDSSTPRSSVEAAIQSNSSVGNDKPNNPRYSFSKSIADLSKKIKNTDISLENFAEEFKKVMQSVSGDSDMFTPAEHAVEKLKADEMYWRLQNDMPGQSSTLFSEPRNSVKESLGEFFRKKSETLSEFFPPSPENNKPPAPLIDDTVTFIEDDIVRDSDVMSRPSSDKSLSLSKIAKLISEETPTKLIERFEGKKMKVNTGTLNPHNNNKLKSNASSVSNQTSKVISNTKVDVTSDQTGNNVSNCHSNISDKVSKNEDSTALMLDSDFSDKENVNSENIPSNNTSFNIRKSPDFQGIDKTLTSIRSVGSLSNLVNGKLPIEATTTELIWGCVKLGRSALQEVFIRNKSQNRLRIQCSVGGPSFKILRDRPDSEYASIARYIFQPGESKVINISFAPIQVGAAVDAVNFAPVDAQLLEHCKCQRIHLSGYGGHGNVEISDVTKDVTQKFWLCLGQLNNKAEISKSFTVHNNGVIPSFALITFESKDLYSFSSIKVSPNKFILLPQEQKEVTVTYMPSRTDMKFLQNILNSSVIDIGVLKLTTGTEANRGRLRKIIQQAIEKGLGVDSACKKIIENIPGEKIPADVKNFKESVQHLHELFQELVFKEIVVTLEQDPDCTLVAQFPDDTLEFETLCHDTIDIAQNEYSKDCFTLEPNCLILTPPSKMQDVFLLTTTCDVNIPFKTVFQPEYLEVAPQEGYLKANRTTIIRVKYLGNTKNNSFDFQVLVDGHTLESEIKVIHIKN